MSIYLAAYSSLTYLARPGALRRAATVTSLADSECSLAAMMGKEGALRSWGCDAGPLHVLAGERSKTRRGDWCACHQWLWPLPPGSFVSPVRNLYVSTPEFCFLQLAGTMSRIELIRLGYELCASYRLDPAEEKGFKECKPLSTHDALLDYLDGASDTVLTRKAEDALRWVVDGSASPRETVTSMLVSLPTEMGGREVGLPELNWEVPGGSGRRIDLCWPEYRFGLEYDSDAEHADAARMAHDSIREKEIELEGIRVARVTNAELKSEDGRELLHKTLCRGLGRRYVAPSKRGKYVRRRLAAMLLAPHYTML